MVKSKCVVKSKSLALALGSIIVTARAADTEGDVYCEDTVGVIGVILASNRYNHERFIFLQTRPVSENRNFMMFVALIIYQEPVFRAETHVAGLQHSETETKHQKGGQWLMMCCVNVSSLCTFFPVYLSINCLLVINLNLLFQKKNYGNMRALARCRIFS